MLCARGQKDGGAPGLDAEGPKAPDWRKGTGKDGGAPGLGAEGPKAPDWRKGTGTLPNAGTGAVVDMMLPRCVL